MLVCLFYVALSTFFSFFLVYNITTLITKLCPMKSDETGFFSVFSAETSEASTLPRCIWGSWRATCAPEK